MIAPTPLRRGALALALAGLVLAAGSPRHAEGGTFPRKEFEALVAEAEQIFVGTVAAMQSERLPSGAIVTDVVFNALDVLKGDSRATKFRLRLLGGTVGDERLELRGVPQFEMGKRYFVFAKGNGRAIFPVVSGDHGLFQVVPDRVTGTLVVVDARGNPIADVPIPLAGLLDAVRDELRR